VNALHAPSPVSTGPTRTEHGRAMCGRAKLDGDVSEIKIAFRVLSAGARTGAQLWC
jgi:hypothetical protein